MDRRSFFTDSMVDEVRKQVSKTQLGWLYSKINPEKKQGYDLDRHTKLFSEKLKTSGRVLESLQSGAPINALGSPLGKDLTSVQMIEGESLDIEAKERYALAVFGHREGISTLRLKEEKGSKLWKLDVSGDQNVNIGAKSEIPIEGGHLDNEEKFYQYHDETLGLGNVRGLIKTPWNTVLCVSDYLSEIDPRTGVITKRFSLGKTTPLAVHIEATAGKPVRVYMVARNEMGFNVYKFISHQNFQAKILTANRHILSLGKLYEAKLNEKEISWAPIWDADPNAWIEMIENLSNSKTAAFSKWPKQMISEDIEKKFAPQNILLSLNPIQVLAIEKSCVLLRSE